MTEFSPTTSRRVRSQRRAAAITRFYRRVSASTLVPGLGLLRTRPVLAAAILLLFVMVVVPALILILVRGPMGAALTLGLDETMLTLALIVTVILGLAWLAGLALTALDNRPSDLTGIPKYVGIGYAVLAWALVFIPVSQAARYVAIQRTVLGTVFEANRPAGAAAPSDNWKGSPRVNILLIGSDAGPDRVGVRPDSTMVASIDTKTGNTVLFGIPRNLEQIPIPKSNPLSAKYPDGYNCGSQCLFENVWTLGEDNASLFPQGVKPGLQTTKDIAGEILGLKIDYTSVIDLSGFTQLVDAMGGVTVNVKERVCIGCKVDATTKKVVGTTGYIEPGVRHLNGYQALWFARSRAMSQDGDFSRMKRQRCLVGALVNQVDPLQMLQRYPQLADVMKNNVTIDIPQDDLPAWANLILLMKDATVSSLPITKEVVDVTKPDYAKIRRLVQQSFTPGGVPTPTPSSSSSTPKPSKSSGGATPSPSQTPQVGAEALAATC